MKNIPNILTLSNLFCGSVACILTITGASLEIILILLLCSLIFDFFDGFVARAVNASGPLGKELDSLADVVSFGLLPGLVMFKMLGGDISLNLIDSYLSGSNYEEFFFLENSDSLSLSIVYLVSLIPFAGLLLTLFSAYRLAKFNLDEEQSYYFKGLPTPANTIFIFSLFYIQQNYNFPLLNNIWVLLIITLIFSYILIANIPLLALKFKSFKWKDNSLVFSFLIVSVLLLIILQILAIPFIIILYIIISIIFRKKITSNGSKTS